MGPGRTESGAASPRRQGEGPPYCVVGDRLCEVLIWSEAEWARLGAERNPVVARHVPGLGWVVAVPCRAGRP